MAVRWFHEVGAKDIEEVGGKGANLGEMTRAGLPVPNGFCVLASAYSQMMQQGNLWPQIQLELTSIQDVASTENAARRIRSLIEEQSIAEDVRGRILRAYDELKVRGQRVAVRSSATAEDLPEASFAGQQDTYLGILGAEQLIDAIRRCWASLWTGRAIAYRNRNGYDHQSVRLSVVVQILVEPEAAGVLFTANPLTGRRDEMLVNASYGLGETVVSGRVTPDVFCLGRALPLKIKHKTLGTKELSIHALPDGGTREEVEPRERRERFCLNDDFLERLVSMGTQVENHYAHPQDIEWALAGGKMYLLQARPVTSLPTETTETEENAPRKLSGVAHRMQDDILEHYPDAPYPLDYEAVTEGYEQLLHALRQFGLRVPIATKVIRFREDGLSWIDAQAPKPTLRLLKLPWILRRLMAANPSSWGREDFADYARELEEMGTILRGNPSDQNLAAAIRKATTLAASVARVRFLAYILPMMLRGVVLKIACRLAGLGSVDWADMLSDLNYKTVEIDADLEALVRNLSASAEARELFAQKVPEVLAALGNRQKPEISARLDDFLRQHGARTMKVYLPFSNRSWREDQGPLIATISAMLRADRPRLPPRASRLAELKHVFQSRFPRLFGTALLATLEKFRHGHVAREGTLYRIEEFFCLARAGTDEAARRLVKAGLLESTDHSRYLTLSELLGILEGADDPKLRDKIALRRKARSRAAALWKGSQIQLVTTGSNQQIKGIPGSPGVASGPARVITGPEDFDQLQSGDVLVCAYTDPAWTPLFSLAAAVVADTGGPLSHAAIVAREYGIPAVLGTQCATDQLPSGTVCEVNGTSGWVRKQVAKDEVRS